MKKLYTAIMIILLALFISCDDKKAKDDITKAITEITDETENVADNTTPKPKGSGTPINTKGEEAEGETESEETEDTPPPALTKPVFFPGESVSWGVPITFPKVAGYTYELKEEKTGVTLSEGASNTMEVTATQSAQNVIIVARFDGKTTESNPIEFTRVPGNTLSYRYSRRCRTRGSGILQTINKSEAVGGDDRKIRYSISPIVNGIIIKAKTGAVEMGRYATYGSYTVTAELPQTVKYTRATATYTLVVKLRCI